MRTLRQVIAENLDSLRRKRGLTHAQFGALANRSADASERWCRGAFDVGTRTLELLCSELGVPIGVIVTSQRGMKGWRRKNSRDRRLTRQVE